MAGKLVTLALFSDPMQAHFVKNQLEAEGIPVFLSGDTAAGLFGGIAATPVHLQVAEENLRRALWVLRSFDDEDDEEAGEETPDRDSSTAICTPRPGEGPIDESAVQASLPPRPMSELGQEEITTSPSSRRRQREKADDIPDLRRRDSSRDIGWLMALEFLFWGGMLLLAVIGCCR